MEEVWGPAATVWLDTEDADGIRSGAEWHDRLILKRIGRNTMRDGEIVVRVYMASRDVIHGRPRVSR